METTIDLDELDSPKPAHEQNGINGKRSAEVLDNPDGCSTPKPAPKKARIRNNKGNVQCLEDNDCCNEPIEELNKRNSPVNSKAQMEAQNQAKTMRSHVAGNVGGQADQRFKNRGARGGGNCGGNDGGNGGGNGGGGGGGGRFSGGGNGYNNYLQRTDEYFIAQRLRNISGSTLELDSMDDNEEFKFAGRNRLYVGNLSTEIYNEDGLRKLFKPYGELGDIFVGPDGKFAFVKVDYHANAEKAKRALDGTTVSGRQLRVRFAPCATVLRVRNLTPFVSNELLYKSFEIFGPVERAVISVDDRGCHMGEGIVEFTKKSSTNICLRTCHEKCFFLTSSLRPCVVEPKELIEANDGLPEKTLPKNNQFIKERSVGPRFADFDSFDHEYGTRWKELYAIYSNKCAALKREMQLEEENLEAKLELVRYERETQILRQELRKREADNERLKLEWEMRQKQSMEFARRDEEIMMRHQNNMQNFMPSQEELVRRRQLNRDYYHMQEQPRGFVGGCDYGPNNMPAENSPFIVFADENNNGNHNEHGAINEGEFNNNFEGNNNNAIMNQVNGPMSDNHALWGRRSL